MLFHSNLLVEGDGETQEGKIGKTKERNLQMIDDGKDSEWMQIRHHKVGCYITEREKMRTDRRD